VQDRDQRRAIAVRILHRAEGIAFRRRLSPT
jgi:hypothetical protein